MYDTPIPMINYVMVGITASVLAYATAMDIDDNTNENPDNSTGWAVDSLPGFDNKETSEPEPVPVPEPVEEPPMPEAEAEVIPETPVPEVEAQLVTEPEKPKQPVALPSIFGGKRSKQSLRNKKSHNKKHKKTRNHKHHK